MKKNILPLWRLMFILGVVIFFSIRTDGRDITIFTTLKGLAHSSFVQSGQNYSTAGLVDMVEVFTGPSSAIYGSRAGVGVISIYTKTSLK